MEQAGQPLPKTKIMYYPKQIVLQWHITDRCNMRCGHCYQQGYHTRDPALEDLVIILEQFKKLLAYWRTIASIPLRARITVTGGEPYFW